MFVFVCVCVCVCVCVVVVRMYVEPLVNDISNQGFL